MIYSIFYMLAAFFGAFAVWILTTSQSVFHDQFAASAFVCMAVFMGSGAIVQSLERISKPLNKD